MALFFVPTDDVVSSYSELLRMLPDDMPPEFDTFLGYFQSTWNFGTPLRHNSTARYPPQTWNVRRRTLSLLNRTNNRDEAFHFSFKRLVGHSNPTIWGFISAMKLQQSTNYSMMTCVLVGEQPPKRKNKYIFKDNRIFHACQQYGELNLIEYLDLLTNL